MKDFKLKGAEEYIKPRTNKKLAEEAVQRTKDTKEVTPEDYIGIVNPKKKGDSIKEVEPELIKAKEEGQLGVPNSFFELSIEEQSMLMFYLSSDFINPITGKRTHMNILHSYVTAYLSEEEIEKVWNIEFDKKGKVTKFAVKNPKKYASLQASAISKFHQNPAMNQAWQDLIKMTFGANPEDMVKQAILKDALEGETSSDRNTNRRMAIDILGLTQSDKDEAQGVNIFLEGGGKELAEVFKNKNTIVTADDLEVEDDD